jgi:hypothetical protein
LIQVLLCAVLSQAIYVYTDASGQTHYTDNLQSVPKGAKVKTTQGQALSVINADKPAKGPESSRLPEATMVDGDETTVSTQPISVTLTEVKVPVSDVDLIYIQDSIASAAASPKLAQWGPLQESVKVEIRGAADMKAGHVDSAFGLAIGKNLMYLRAPQDVVHRGPLPYESCVLHELAHSIEHQKTNNSPRPDWFAEGFANFVSQGPVYASRSDMAWCALKKGTVHALGDAFENCQIPVAYALGTEAVNYLVTLVGQGGIEKMFAFRKKRISFEKAFEQVAKMSVDEFEKQFLKTLQTDFHEHAQ